jgi:hypothetical protein
MSLAYPMQKFQDWFTQQWVIFWGTKISHSDYSWLIGPFGNLNGIGEDFINQLAAKENLIIQREIKSHGLIPSIEILKFSENELSKVSRKVIDFYENTSNYNLNLTVKWNPLFKIFGIVVNKLFSNRINQLNLPIESDKNETSLKSELITLSDANSHKVKYTVWLRTSTTSGQVMYSGIYGTCELPSGKTCIKAVFPLPQGNATVILNPSVGGNGELILESSGRKIGDAGFYFLLKDYKGNYWTQFISSFRDRLTIDEDNDGIKAEQILTLWKQNVVRMNYKIEPKIQLNDEGKDEFAL